MHSDFLELLQLLNSHKVRYLIIGGYAVSFQAEPRHTKDLDIWIEASKSNGKKLLKALGKFGAPIANLSEQDISTPGLLYIFGIPPLRIDILNRLKGSSFAVAYSKRTKFKVGDITIPVVGLADLMRIKRAAGRPQDLADLARLKLYSNKPRLKRRRK